MDSEKIKSMLTNWRITIPVGVVVGILIGLLFGWGIWPVEWTDLAPYHLRPDLREDYLRMAILTTSTTGDTSIATKAWSELEDTAEETLESVSNDTGYLTLEQISNFMLIVGAAEDIQSGEDVLPTSEVPSQVTLPAEGEAEERSGPNWLLLGGFCILLIVAAAVVIYFFVIRTRPAAGDQPEPLQSMGRGMADSGVAMDYAEEEMDYDQPAGGYEQPMQDEQQMPVAQFMTTFMMGDDLYDDSFSIDAPTGEFLGECGVGISDTVGVGEPKRVSALEVWLFDKNDIQTVTKVVMSEHVYEDNQVRMRLESKGEPILAEPGKVILLETATLQLEARIIDMEYGEGAAPDQSFFQRLTLELAVWPKVRGSF